MSVMRSRKFDNTNNLRLEIERADSVSTVETVTASLKQLVDVDVDVIDEDTLHVEIGICDNDFPLRDLVSIVDSLGYKVLTEKTMLAVQGMTCAACVGHVESALIKLTGVTDVSVSLATDRAVVEHPIGLVSVSDMCEAVEDSGYKAFKLTGSLRQNKKIDNVSDIRLKTIVSGFSALIIMILMFLPPISEIWFAQNNYAFLLLATPAQFWAGYSFHRATWAALKRGNFDMNTLISLGTSVTFFYSMVVTVFGASLFFEDYKGSTFFDTSTAIIALVSFGRYLEIKAKKKTANAIDTLYKLRPAFARVEIDGAEVEVSAEGLKVGDVVVIRPGERLPADGYIIEGSTAIDESMLTGESLPVDKYPEDSVFSATVNNFGSIKYRVTQTSQGSFLSKIITMVEEAQNSKAPIQRVADVIASYFVPSVMLFSILTLMAWLILGPSPAYIYAILTSVSVLIIACPCAMGLATPAAITVGIGKGAQKGILIKNASALETACKIDTVVMDKTGTLTIGEPSVRSIVGYGLAEREVLQTAYALEINSEHPLGKAIVKEAERFSMELLSVTGFMSKPGEGVSALFEGKEIHFGNLKLMLNHKIKIGSAEEKAKELMGYGHTVSYLAFDGEVRGLISLSDVIREEAVEAVNALRVKGIEVIMMTGDNFATAAAVAKQAEIENVISDLLPNEKLDSIVELQMKGCIVAMLGDGINDAPALAQSDVGIAIGTGTDVAINSSDITLLGTDIRSVSVALDLSKATMRIIKQNLFWAFAYNLMLIPVAAGAFFILFNQGNVPDVLVPALGEYGFLNPIMAAGAMAISSVMVVLNSLRLGRF